MESLMSEDEVLRSDRSGRWSDEENSREEGKSLDDVSVEQ